MYRRVERHITDMLLQPLLVDHAKDSEVSPSGLRVSTVVAPTVTPSL